MTNRLLRSLAAAGCALAVLSGCSTAASGAPATSPAAADLPPGGVPGVPVPAIDWTDAGEGFQQATAQVPYDYAEPGGRTLGLHLVRLPASDPAHRIGSLFVNPGGPGQPAAAFVRQVGTTLLPPEVLARYDLVGVDPRGTGDSRPVSCTGSLAEQEALPYATAQAFPTTPAEEREAAAQVARFAELCRAANGDLLDHVGTLTSARDLDVLRAALGDERINLFGMSYGTFLGQVVANAFPDRIGALVLDAVLDPAWVTGGAGSVNWVRANADVGNWETLQRFFQLCTEAGPQRCAPAGDGDPARLFAALADRLRTTPLEITLPGRPARPLGYDDLVLLTSGMLRYPWMWPTLGRFLSAAERGDAQAAAEALGEFLPAPTTEHETSLEAGEVIACADTDNPRDQHAYTATGRRRDRTVAPYFGSWWASQARVCASWAGRSSERWTGPWTARTSTPVLLLTTRYDPATPYRSAVRVHHLLRGSALVTVDGVGHGAYGTSSCATELMAHYLLTGATPPDTECAADLVPFEP